MKLLRASIPSTIKIVPALATRPLVIMADPTQIHQVLMNLCTNAAYAMRERGGQLYIGLTEEKIGQDLAFQWGEINQGNYVKLTVRDSGEGMSQEVAGRIFEPFYTTKPKEQGTGLGLSVVHGIVKNHLGAIRISSVVGVGTTAEVILPMLEMGQLEEPSAGTHPLARGNGEHVLIVDDELDIAKVLKESLKQLGYRPLALSSGLAALKLFRERPGYFQLILTDQTMPDMTGLELGWEIRKIRQDIPILLCSGYSDRISEAKLEECGIRELLLKPIRIGTLAASLAGALAAGGGKNPDGK